MVELESFHVFISYVREDASLVDEIARRLAHEGVISWVDRERLKPGADWKDAIHEAINRGRYFMACFSNQYLSKTRTYMNKELNLAIEELEVRGQKANWFIPCKLEPCEIPALRIGGSRLLTDIHCIDMYNDMAKSVSVLARMIQPLNTFDDIQRHKARERFYTRYLDESLKPKPEGD